jgi:hypothetical protein
MTARTAMWSAESPRKAYFAQLTAKRRGHKKTSRGPIPRSPARTALPCGLVLNGHVFDERGPWGGGNAYGPVMITVSDHDGAVDQNGVPNSVGRKVPDHGARI